MPESSLPQQSLSSTAVLLDANSTSTSPVWSWQRLGRITADDSASGALPSRCRAMPECLLPQQSLSSTAVLLDENSTMPACMLSWQRLACIAADDSAS